MVPLVTKGIDLIRKLAELLVGTAFASADNRQEPLRMAFWRCKRNSDHGGSGTGKPDYEYFPDKADTCQGFLLDFSRIQRRMEEVREYIRIGYIIPLPEKRLVAVFFSQKVQS